MLGQQRRVGASADWSRLRYTMDEGSAKAVREAFTRLYRDGLAYRTEALINWCPGCLTSVCDLEVIPTPETGTLWTIRYHLIDEATGPPDPELVCRDRPTTRPETMLGDVAVAVHPDDDRYRDAPGAARPHPVHRPGRSDHRRRARRARVRDRCREDHAGARSRRLRDGQRHGLPIHRRDDRRGPDQRKRRPRSRAWSATTRAAGSWPI